MERGSGLRRRSSGAGVAGSGNDRTPRSKRRSCGGAPGSSHGQTQGQLSKQPMQNLVQQQQGGMKRRRLSGKRASPFASASPQTRAVDQQAQKSGIHLAAPLAALAGGPYFVMASWLDAGDLCRMDAVCRLVQGLNSLPVGPWRVWGEQAFSGMELDMGGGFLPFQEHSRFALLPVSGRIGWKARCQFFHREVPTFSAPFSGREIAMVENPDEVAYCRCRLRSDLIVMPSSDADTASSSTSPPSSDVPSSGKGVYVEVEVAANADNLSLAVVDFEGGGRSSVTFSPETGAVLRERKVRELPRAIEGTYIHLLPAAPPGRRFEGTMGLYLSSTGHLAFFRRWATNGEETNTSRNHYATQTGTASAAAHVAQAAGSLRAQAPTPAGPEVPSMPWETTGFCTDLSWAQGPRLSLCLAFRDNGAYRVRLSRVCRAPPILPAKSADAYQEDRWNLLYGDDDHPLAI